MPAQMDLTIYCGDTYNLVLTLHQRVEDPDNPGQLIPGDPLDLTGHTAKSQIRTARRTVSVTPPLAEFKVMNAPLGADGRIALRLTAREAEKLANNLNTVWDLQVISPDKTVLTYVTGKVTATQDVTQLPEDYPLDGAP